MALKKIRIDAVVALVLVFLAGYGLAALFPGQEWIETATWTVALGLALVAIGRRWGGSSGTDVDWLRLPEEDEADEARGADRSDEGDDDDSSPSRRTHP